MASHADVVGQIAVQIGVFVEPRSTDATMTQVLAAEDAHLDLVAVQDHPYQRLHFDTWTLLAYAAGQTRRVRLMTDVASLPLRPPAALAKAAASLDVLSGGRVELGLGAGHYWDQIAGMGGPRRTPPEAVDSLSEAIDLIHAYWHHTGPLSFEGLHYQVSGLRPGPAPAHPIGIWVGGQGPRMMRLTGEKADGWLPSLAPEGLGRDQLLARHSQIDDSARAAGRDPADIVRALNVFRLDGEPNTWADTLTELVADWRFSTLLIGVPDEDPTGFIRRLGEEVAPVLRDKFQ